MRGDIGPNLLFRNRGDGTFAEVGAAAGVALAGGRSAGPLFADLDGDHRLDLVVGGVEGTAPSVFRNAGDGTFIDVTAASGIALPTDRDTYSISAADYDRDGDLDLFLSHWLSSYFTIPDTSSYQLWRNDGSGTFTDVTLAAGIVPLGPSDNFNSFTANFADIDGDRWPDLLVTGDFFTSRIYRNNRAGGFVLATDFTVISEGNAMGAAVGDYDGDGDLDWFVSSIWDPNGIAEGNWDVSGNRLYRNRGDGSFDDVTDAAGVREGYWGWASTFQDFDNDGDLDLFHVNGFGTTSIPETAEFVADPSVFFVNDGDGTFVERGAELGVADTDEGRGVVAFDYDADGDLDLFVHNSEAPGRLYRNDGGNAGHWLDVALRGRAPNTEGVGAWVRVTADGRTQLRELRAGSNYASQDPVVAHVGLGGAPSASVEVLWPDGTRSVREDVPANQRL
ncbi:MAG: CRTAC1 family protein, partial [Candidatus Binatia bacterium]